MEACRGQTGAAETCRSTRNLPSVHMQKLGGNQDEGGAIYRTKQGKAWTVLVRKVHIHIDDTSRIHHLLQ